MIALSLVVLVGAAQADFATAKKAAQEIESLRTSVTALVGACDLGDPLEQQECQQTLKKRRADIRSGGPYYVYLGVQERGLRLEGARGDKIRVLWDPVVDTGTGLAITLQKPRKLSARGNVVVKTMPLDVTPGDGVTTSSLKRAFRTGQVGVEVIGTFGKTWSLGRGKARIRGVIFSPQVLRLLHARTGETLGVLEF